jgi:heavy metal sensor kinase
MFSAIRTALSLRSVRARLTFWYLLTLGACLLAFSSFVYAIRYGTLYRELDTRLEVRTQRLSDQLRPELLALDVGSALAQDVVLRDLPVTVWESPDRLLFRSEAFPHLSWRAESDVRAAAREETPVLSVVGQGGDDIRIFSTSVRRQGTTPVVVQVAESTADLRRTLRQLAMTMTLTTIVVLVIAAYGSGFTTRRALAPIDVIVARVEQIQAAHAGERLDIRAGSDEIDRLIATLNGMLDRLDQSMRGARRFAADASHELQTPIAVMRAGVEVCERDPQTPAEYRAMSADLLVQIERLSALVRDLRLLALADAGQLFTETSPVDLSTVTAECCEMAAALGEPKEIRVETELAESIVVMGNALHLRRAVLNIAQNAIQYSPPASAVTVALGRHDGHAVISVTDRGCGISDEAVAHIFERFYRSDAARTRQTGGTGLGLAIADQIVRLHGGHLAVTSAPGRGSTFVISVPLAH